MAMYDFSKNSSPPEGKVLPYTDKPFLDSPEDFHFAIIGDRSGSERKGFFGETMKALNLLRPEFTICVGDLDRIQADFMVKGDSAFLHVRAAEQGSHLLHDTHPYLVVPEVFSDHSVLPRI